MSVIKHYLNKEKTKYKPERGLSAAELHEVACYYGFLVFIIKPSS